MVISGYLAFRHLLYAPIAIRPIGINLKETKGKVMGEFRRAYSGQTKKEAHRIAKSIRKRKVYKTRIRKDPNGRYEVWLG